MNVVVDELLTTYHMSGNGPVVLLLHGWGDSSKGLVALQRDLSAAYTVISMDLPGFGATQAPKGIWDLDNYAAFVRDFLDKLDLSPAAIVGHSNGGALAIRGLATGRLSADKLVLLAASGIRTGRSAKRVALNVIAKTGNVATIWLPKAARQKLRQKLYGAAGSDLLVVEHLQETFKKTVRQDVQADAAQLTLPTLLIYAEKDTAVPLVDGTTYHRLIKQSRLETIADAGHFVHLDASTRVSGLILEFLRG